LAEIPQLANILGVTLQHLAIVAAAEYLAGELRDPAIDSLLVERFKKPLPHGLWAEVLRTVLTFLRQRGSTIFTAPLIEVYFADHAQQKAGALKEVVDELVSMRNQLLKKSGGAVPPRKQHQDFKRLLVEFLKALSFLQDYPLVSVKNAKVQEGIKTHRCWHHVGLNDALDQIDVACNLDIEQGRVAVLSPRDRAVLYLHPFYLLRECPEDGCGAVHLFRFEKLDSGRTESTASGGHCHRDTAAGAHLNLLLQGGGKGQVQLAKYLSIFGLTGAWQKLPPRTVIDNKYEIVEHLRRGGMADVYKVRGVGGDAVFALKLLPYQFLRDMSLLHRFRQEVLQARVLDHPHITRVLDAGESLEDHYLVMELAPGWARAEGRVALDVSELPKPLPEADALDIVKQTCDGLTYLHGKGVVHRDVKPGNLLLFDDKQVKLADFGIARSRETIALTSTGLPVGTTEYMSPEQAEGKDELTPASDIYSLGAVLYELLTGISPFKRKTPLATALARLHESVPDPRSANPRISDGLRGILLKCLAREPSQRYRSARDLYQAIAAEEGKPPLPPPAPPGPWLRRTSRASIRVACGLLTTIPLLVLLWIFLGMLFSLLAFATGGFLGAVVTSIILWGAPTLFIRSIRGRMQSILALGVVLMGAASSSFTAMQENALHIAARIPGLAVPLLQNAVLLQGSGAWFNESTRTVAAGELGEFGANARGAVPALTDALKSENSDVFQNAAYVLGKIGPEARGAVPYLIRGLREHKPAPSQEGYGLAGGGFGDSYQLRAEGALCGIGAAAVPELAKLLDDPDLTMKDRAIRILGCIGPQAKDAVPELMKALAEAKNPEERRKILLALRNIGPEAGQAAFHIMMLAKECDNSTYEACIAALGALGNAREVVPFLIDELKKGSRPTYPVILALGTFGTDARAAIPLLKGMLEDSTKDPQEGVVVGALRRIGPEAFPVLQEALKSPRLGVRVVAASALIQANDHVEEAIQVLIAEVQQFQSVEAMNALSALGPQAKAAVPTLVTVMNRGDVYFRLHAASALWHIDRKFDLTVLEAGLRSQYPETRKASVEILGMVGPDASATLPELIRLRRTDPDAGVQMAGWKAIGKIDPLFGWYRRLTPQQQFEDVLGVCFLLAWLVSLGVETFWFRWTWLRRLWHHASH
jgi:serine/threonine protein kinase/HEAT repeat protein